MAFIPANYFWGEENPIPQGADAEFEFEVRPGGVVMDTTGWLGRGQVRPAPGSPKLVGTLVVTPTAHVAGKWRAQAPAAAFVAYNFGVRKSALDAVECHYDVELYNPNTNPVQVMRVVQGPVRISVNVTTSES